ncbi:Lrp/AsnC family transcriptional regulator [Mucilaginibacter gilvus]|uniref:Lrp/AsnC family transcriptional regulator n=1 Tax=Mucilaginibacter gilvus TaxID=2305909 RepID=A0A3S3XF59_9SPHI|nr:Lrp/AsnC family transcriptional regulator [Mucilaginibacter gilvus]RWY57122.1 Lrp/AsnC family transcriptional regulator [Mucilaginibacter gilvus]
MAKLDRTDLLILKSLQKNSKFNITELCEEVNMSKTPVYERIKRLEEDGFIKQYVALVDHKKVGLPLVIFCNVSLNVHNAEHIERFTNEILKLDEVTECYSLGGVFDFLLKFVLEDLDAYNKFVFEKLTRIQDIVKMQSSIVLQEIKHTTQLNLKLPEKS